MTAADLLPGMVVDLPHLHGPQTVRYVYTGPNTYGYVVVRLVGGRGVVDQWLLPDVEVALS